MAGASNSTGAAGERVKRVSEWGESGDSEVVVVVVVVVQDGRVASRISRRRKCVSVNTVLATERGRAGNEDVQRLPNTPNKHTDGRRLSGTENSVSNTI